MSAKRVTIDGKSYTNDTLHLIPKDFPGVTAALDAQGRVKLDGDLAGHDVDIHDSQGGTSIQSASMNSLTFGKRKSD